MDVIDGLKGRFTHVHVVRLRFVVRDRLTPCLMP
jgi:hypothetical protein